MNLIDFDTKVEETLNDNLRIRGSNFIKGLLSLLVIADVIITTFLMIVFRIKNISDNLHDLQYFLKISVIFIIVFIFFTSDRSQSSLILSIQQTIKRIFDVIFTVLSIFLLSPIIISISILIKLESPGPILFSTKRVGQFGKLFDMFKFRTMELSKENKLTRIGKFLRITSLNDLPALLSVLTGDLSLVGPYPRLFGNINNLYDEGKKIISIRPGLVGLWQVSGKSVDDLIEMDLIYLENWSICKDVKILIKTLTQTIKIFLRID